jgi:hypothetical protein
VARPGAWKTATLLFSSAAIGNLLSIVLPPHAIVDFFYSMVFRVLFRQGIANLADLYFDAALVCSVVAAASALWRLALPRRGRTQR